MSAIGWPPAKTSGLALIVPTLGFGHPKPRIIAFEEGLAYIAALPSDLDPPWSRTEASNTSPFSRALCVHCVH